MMRKLLMGLAILPMSVWATTLSVDGYTFTTGGDADWYVDTDTSYDGVSSLRSGAVDDDEATWLSLNINESTDVVLSFRWRASSEGLCDPLAWYVDGIEKAEIGGSMNGWGLQWTVLTPGPHTIKWEYSKDGDETDRDDCGWIDVLTIRAARSKNITYYVDGATGTDDNDGVSLATAKATIQAAIDISEDGDVILVSSGMYAPIVTSNKSILIKAVEGATRTFIDGGGANTCAKLCETGDSFADTNRRRTTLAGFTLQHGYSYGSAAAVLNGTVKNCIICNCRGETLYGASICSGSNISDSLAYMNSCISIPFAHCVRNGMKV